MKIHAQLSNYEAQKAKVKNVLVKTMPAIERTVRTEALNIVAVVKRDKLSDQILRVRTGRLRRSITAEFKSEGETFLAMVGTNVKYARAHELGFDGTVNVTSHAVKAFTRMQSTAFGKPMKEPRIVNVRAHVVKAHAVKMHIPKRPFLRPAAEENITRMTTNIREAMAGVLK